MEREKGDEESPVIIAMKGHPGTGKSTLARAVAKSLKCPLIDKDDVRDCTHTLQQTSPALAPNLLNDLSYHVICQIASTQLKLGMSVVIDSPLSRRSHLDRLLQVAASTGSGLVIVECKPSDESEWRRRLERRVDSWHKPSTWHDLERLLEGYGGCWGYDVGDMPKLVVDTTAPSCTVEDLVSGVLEFIDSASVSG